MNGDDRYCCCCCCFALKTAIAMKDWRVSDSAESSHSGCCGSALHHNRKLTRIFSPSSCSGQPVVTVSLSDCLDLSSKREHFGAAKRRKRTSCMALGPNCRCAAATGNDLTCYERGRCNPSRLKWGDTAHIAARTFVQFYALCWLRLERC